MKPGCNKCDTAHFPGDPCRFLLHGQEPPTMVTKWAAANKKDAAYKKAMVGRGALQSSRGKASAAPRKIRTLPTDVYNDPWRLAQDKTDEGVGGDSGLSSSRSKVREGIVF